MKHIHSESRRRRICCGAVSSSLQNGISLTISSASALSARKAPPFSGIKSPKPELWTNERSLAGVAAAAACMRTIRQLRSHSTDTKCMPFSSQMNLFLPVGAVVLLCWCALTLCLTRKNRKRRLLQRTTQHNPHVVCARKCIIPKFYRISKHQHAYFIEFLCAKMQKARTKQAPAFLSFASRTQRAMRVLMGVLWMRRRHHHAWHVVLPAKFAPHKRLVSPPTKSKWKQIEWS